LITLSAIPGERPDVVTRSARGPQARPILPRGGRRGRGTTCPHHRASADHGKPRRGPVSEAARHRTTAAACRSSFTVRCRRRRTGTPIRAKP